MKIIYVIFVLVLHMMCIESRTAWLISRKREKMNDSALVPTTSLNISSSDVKTFVKVLTILKQQLIDDVKSEDRKIDLERIMMQCTGLDTENQNKVGIILPIPYPLEDLTLVSLLYSDNSNWSRCTRSCKSQRLRKCRKRGLCSLDYLIEEAFCFFPESKCEKRVEKLIKNLAKKKKIENGDESEYYGDNKQDEQYDDDIHHHHHEDYENNPNYYENNQDDYGHNHDDYGHNHDDYGHNQDDYSNQDIDYPANDEGYYDDTQEPEDYDSNSFWDDSEYTYGDPDASYDYNNEDNYDEYDSEEEQKDEEKEDHLNDTTCGLSHAGVPKRSFRIVGGHRAVKGAWPWQVAIVDQFGMNFCGGTIIGPRWVLTAAHCVKRRIRVRIGEHDVSRYDGEVEIKVRKSFPHPHFDLETFDKDIALLKLSKNVFNAGKFNTKKACLPKKSSKSPKKKKCVVLGWGSEKESHIYGSDVLMYAKVPIVSDQKCHEAYSDFYMTKHMFCAGFLRGGPDTCSGDSGGPLLCQDKEKRWVLHGITSFGDGCGQSGRFGVYTKVRNFLHWINITISEN